MTTLPGTTIFRYLTSTGATMPILAASSSMRVELDRIECWISSSLVFAWALASVLSTALTFSSRATVDAESHTRTEQSTAMVTMTTSASLKAKAYSGEMDWRAGFEARLPGMTRTSGREARSGASACTAEAAYRV